MTHKISDRLECDHLEVDQNRQHQRTDDQQERQRTPDQLAVEQKMQLEKNDALVAHQILDHQEPRCTPDQPIVEQKMQLEQSELVQTLLVQLKNVTPYWATDSLTDKLELYYGMAAQF